VAYAFPRPLLGKIRLVCRRCFRTALPSDLAPLPGQPSTVPKGERPGAAGVAWLLLLLFRLAGLRSLDRRIRPALMIRAARVALSEAKRLRTELGGSSYRIGGIRSIYRLRAGPSIGWGGRRRNPHSLRRTLLSIEQNSLRSGLSQRKTGIARTSVASMKEFSGQMGRSRPVHARRVASGAARPAGSIHKPRQTRIHQ
jgi:hypothetical protein